MSQERKTFVFYKEWGDMLLSLPLEHKANVIDAIIRYAIYDELPQDDNIRYGAFAMIKPLIDQDRAKYERRCEANRSNGKSGGRPPKRTQQNPMGLEKPTRPQTNLDNDNDNDNDNVSKEKDKKKSGKRFSPPTLEELTAYIQENGYNIDAAQFIDYYKASDWKLSNGNNMKDWQAAVRNWVRRDIQKPKASTASTQTKPQQPKNRLTSTI